MSRVNILHHTSQAIEAIDQTSAVSLSDALSSAVKNVRGFGATVQVSSSTAEQEKKITTSVDRSLVAVITVEDDTRYLTQTMTSVMTQTVLPSVVLIANCAQGADKLSSSAKKRLENAAHAFPVPTHVIPVHATSFGGSVTAAVNTAFDQGIITSDAEYLWIMHDDSKPGHSDYVEMLNEMRRNNAQVSLIGSKQLSWDGEVLTNVGYYASPRHTVTSLSVDGETDQDQYNSRRDVFAVSLAGAFVRIADWMRIGGFCEAAKTFGQSRDYSRRVVRSGGRVIVEPRAYMHHRRARFDGVRTMQGEVYKYDPKDSRTKRNNTFAVLRARDAYFYSDIARVRWLYMWIASIIVSLVRAARNVSVKNPFEAWCELALPWYNLVHCAAYSSMRSALTRVRAVSMAKLGSLIATGEQMRVVKERHSDLLSQHNVKVLSPLVRKHLREQMRMRYMWLGIVALVALVAHIAINFATLRAIIGGGHLVSDVLTSTSSTTRQLFEAATTPYNFAGLDGSSLPPSPFLLVYALASVLTFGHASQTSTLIFILGVPAAVMSMWALAGTFTRSNLTRNVVALSWAIFGYFSGIFPQGNLAMIMVMVFLPASLAFAAKAMGIYRTEEPIEPEPSVQAGAWAALCFALVSASEPQIFVIMIISAVFIALIYRRRVWTIVSMAIPSVVILLPTLISIIRHRELVGQLFSDVSVHLGQEGQTLHVSTPLNTVTSFILSGNNSESGVDKIVFIIALVSLALLVILTLATLTVPRLVRPSRTMWCILVTAVFMANVTTHTIVASGRESLITAPVIPTISVIVLVILAASSMMSGPATARFVSLIPSDTTSAPDGEQPSVPRGRVFFGVSRAIAVAAVLVLSTTWAYGTATAWSDHTSVQSSNAQLPMVVRDYLNGSSQRRIAVVRLDANNSLSYSVARSSYGDIINSSAARDVYRATTSSQSKAEKQVAASLAQLTQGNDDNAIEALSNAGLGGIYVIGNDSDSAFTRFVANATASDSTETLVNTDTQAYIRISTKPIKEQGISQRAYDTEKYSVVRVAWVVSLIAVLVIYLALALPSIFTRGEE